MLKQLDLFRRRPVEPEDVEADVRRQILMLAGCLITEYPPINEDDLAWQRYGLGPVQDIPRENGTSLRGADRWQD